MTSLFKLLIKVSFTGLAFVSTLYLLNLPKGPGGVTTQHKFEHTVRQHYHRITEIDNYMSQFGLHIGPAILRLFFCVIYIHFTFCGSVLGNFQPALSIEENSDADCTCVSWIGVFVFVQPSWKRVVFRSTLR